MSFILDALRKSEHERQRSTVPGLSQVPLATPRPEIPRWTFILIGVLAVAVLALGGAWWRSARAPAATQSAPPLVERRVELPPPAITPAAAPTAADTITPQPTPALPAPRPAPSPTGESLLAAAAPAGAATLQDSAPAPVDATVLPSAAALVAEGIALPPLRLELHAYSERPRDRFVFINGRRYVEGDRLPEGPQVVTIEPRGAVLSHLGRRFLLVPE